MTSRNKIMLQFYKIPVSLKAGRDQSNKKMVQNLYVKYRAKIDII